MRAKQRVLGTAKEKPKTVQKRLRPELPEMWKTFLQKERGKSISFIRWKCWFVESSGTRNKKYMDKTNF